MGFFFSFFGTYPGKGQVHSLRKTNCIVWCKPWLPSHDPNPASPCQIPPPPAAAAALPKDPAPQPAPPSMYSSLPFPSLQNSHPHFIRSPLSATPAKQGLLTRSHRPLAVPRTPILWVPPTAAPHDGALQVPGGLQPSLPALPSQRQWEASLAKEKYVPEVVTQPVAQRSYS